MAFEKTGRGTKHPQLIGGHDWPLFAANHNNLIYYTKNTFFLQKATGIEPTNVKGHYYFCATLAHIIVPFQHLTAPEQAHSREPLIKHHVKHTQHEKEIPFRHH